MEAVTRVEGVVCPLDRADVDTDQIIPKQFLKRIERTGFGEFLFWDWRGEEGFPLDRPEYAGAPILVTGRNFGCGSSREHAPVGAPGRTASGRSSRRASPTSSAPTARRSACCRWSSPRTRCAPSGAGHARPGVTAAVDLERQVVVSARTATRSPSRSTRCMRERLLNGWDDIALTLAHEDEIAPYEREPERDGPVTTRFA